METNKICLASDNWSPAHPEIIKALSTANDGYSPAYGGDPWSVDAQLLIQSALGKPAQVLFVPTGTGANIFALKLACRGHQSVICTDIAHIHYQESGAPEAIVGCKLLTVPHECGKITPVAIVKKLKSERAFGKHSTSPGVVSLAQPTEVGTVYTLDELSAISALCQQENLLLHIDGSRIYNAAVSLGVELHEMFRLTTVDILSLGGTKNGLLGAEALVIFNQKLQAGSDFLQKQTLQLLSKMRYLSAQYVPYFKQKLWHGCAEHANHMAQAIANTIEGIPACALSYPVESNQIFFTVPAAWIAPIQEEIFCLLWDKEINQLRFIASFTTSLQDVARVHEVLSRLSASLMA